MEFILANSQQKIVDTSGDKEMLVWADEGHYKFFH